MLAHSLITSESANPLRYMLFLHGILGSRANWRGIARRFVEARPDWGAILVDLREHGDSLGLQAPHTLAAAARDLGELERSLEVRVGGALGHSFGGKVVLEWLRGRDGTPSEAWLIDSSPSPTDSGRDSTATVEVLRTLQTLPRDWPSREAFVSSLVEAGQPEPIAQWLAMNLRPRDGGGRSFGPELSVIRDLLEDYARTDSWPVVEGLPQACTLDLVIGGRSAMFSAADRQRIERLASENPRVSVHRIEESGHWVHVDSAPALLALLTSQRGPQR